MAFKITVNKTRDLLIDKFDRMSVDTAMGWLEGSWPIAPDPTIDKALEVTIKAEFDRLENLSEENLTVEYDAYRERRRKEEIAGHWYNKDNAKADFSHWKKMPYWSLEEGLILISGRDPRFVTLERLYKRHKSVPFTCWLRDVLELASRSVNIDVLKTQNTPSVFISWAKRNELDIPTELKDYVLSTEPNFHSLNQTIEDQKKIISKLENELEKSVNSPKVKKPDPREIRSLQKTIIAILIDCYGYTPFKRKGQVIKDVLNALSEQGFEVSDDTIRKIINQSEKHLPYTASE